MDDTSAAIRTQLKIDGHIGLTCHVCRKGGKLVRMCACSGKNGFAHIACLEKKAAKSVEDAVNKRGPRVPHSEQSWARWNACPFCGAEYVGQLSNALGWACWRTYCPVWKSDEVATRLSCLRDASWTAWRAASHRPIQPAGTRSRRERSAPSPISISTQRTAEDRCVCDWQLRFTPSTTGFLARGLMAWRRSRGRRICSGA